MSTLEKREEIVAYLLGELDRAEADSLENSLMADEGLFAHIQAVESELYGDYAAGELSARRHRLFAERYLRTDSDLKRLAFAQTLGHHVSSVVEDILPKTEGVRWWKKWQTSIFAGSGVLVALAIVLLVVRPGSSSLPGTASMTLGESGLRSAEGIASLPKATEVVVRVEIPVGQEGPFELRLLRGDKELSRTQVHRSGTHVEMTLRPEQLSAGIYELELLALRPGDTAVVLGYYSFHKQ